MTLTDYSNFYSRFIDYIYCTPGAARSETARLITARLPDRPLQKVNDKADIPAGHRTRRTLFVTEGRGMKVGRCPGSRGHICCNYLTVNLYEGCPIGCTYCIMQSYLNFLPVTINVDTAPMIREIERLAAANPAGVIRIGTGEVGDSLFYDPLCELSRPLVEACARIPNVIFELKTKTHFVDHLLDIPEKGRAVIGFSLNPPNIIAEEEPYAARLDERLDAARRARRAGFRLAFHFDPILRVPGWEAAYRETVGRLKEFGAEGDIAWISLGTMRYPGELRDRLADRPYLFDEYVRCRDGKFRYLQPVRRRMYRRMLQWIREEMNAPVYLCMESPAVWRKVFGDIPEQIPDLCDIFSYVKLTDSHANADTIVDIGGTS
jgi:spore photoproduct lyase